MGLFILYSRGGEDSNEEGGSRFGLGVLAGSTGILLENLYGFNGRQLTD